jgi:acetyl esterase
MNATGTVLRSGAFNRWATTFKASAESREIGLHVFSKNSGKSRTAELLPLVVYFHGGFFTCGAVEDADGIASALAEKAVVVAVDYPLAGDASFQGITEVAFEALQWAYEHAEGLGADGARVMVAGDQAGGNLAAAVAMIARDRLTPTSRGICLKGQILITPMLDPSQSTKSMKTLGKCVCRQGWAAYLPAAGDALHPSAAPAQSRRLGGLVPALVITAQNDALRDEAEQYASSLIGAGVPVQVRRFAAEIGQLVDPAHASFSSVISTIKQFIQDPA